MATDEYCNVDLDNGLAPQCLRNYIGTSAFADVSYLMADVEATFYV